MLGVVGKVRGNKITSKADTITLRKKYTLYCPMSFLNIFFFALED